LRALQPSAGGTPVTSEVSAGRRNILEVLGHRLREQAADYQRQQHASSGLFPHANAAHTHM